MSPRSLALVASLTLLGASQQALAAESAPEPDPRAGTGTVTSVHVKDMGVHSPRGRRIYRDNEPFEEVVDSHRRIFVIEAVAGTGPEGNVGLVVGFLPKQLKGIEFFGGGGIDVGPALYVSGAVRFVFNLGGVRPYLGAGYFFKDAFAVGAYAHNAFFELGHTWRIGSTNHLSLGVGIARLVHVGVREDSPLRTPDVDPTSLELQRASVSPYTPLLSLRVSRAF